MLSNGKVFYKILSHDEFIEIQFIGSKKMQITVKAVQYPEKLRILDMLAISDTFLEIKEPDKALFN